MKEYIKKEYKPILIGIVAFWVLYAFNEFYGNMLIRTGIIKIETIGSNGTEAWNWHPLLAISNIISACILILPGYLSGWFSTHKGTLNGCIVVLFCQIIKYFAFNVNLEGLEFDMYLLIMLFQQLVVPVSIGAVSGAAGQLHNRKKELITSH